MLVIVLLKIAASSRLQFEVAQLQIVGIVLAADKAAHCNLGPNRAIVTNRDPNPLPRPIVTGKAVDDTHVLTSVLF